jgi:ATP-dependent HslUV protease ATP-binding subunit HslU
VELVFEEGGIAELARVAAHMNERTQNIGARRLHTVLEKLLDDVSFTADSLANKAVRVDAAYVRSRLDPILQDEDLSRYIL